MSAADEFLDILTGLRIQDPVRAADGHLYDRNSITDWIERLVAAGLPIVSPLPPSHPMERTLVGDASARERLNQLLRDLELNDPGSPLIKTLKALRAAFDVLDPLEDVLNTVLDGWKVRLTTRHSNEIVLSSSHAARQRSASNCTPSTCADAGHRGPRQRVERQVVADRPARDDAAAAARRGHVHADRDQPADAPLRRAQGAAAPRYRRAERRGAPAAAAGRWRRRGRRARADERDHPRGAPAARLGAARCPSVCHTLPHPTDHPPSPLRCARPR